MPEQIPGPCPIPFGIPQLDHLLGFQDKDLKSFTGSLFSPTSITIVGEDGTGKSVFGLHLASTYCAVHYRAVTTGSVVTDPVVPARPPLIVYASSDLRKAAARKVWSNFRLDYPWLRYIPSLGQEERKFRAEELSREPLRVQLESVPLRNVPAHALQCLEQPKYSVLFLDLADETSGDDWMFISRLVAARPRYDNEPPHLLIVDSVAGFETLVGTRNSFGEETTRRSRISQLLKAAANSWHIALISEEPDGVRHHPEEYVTDTVVHLRRSASAETVSRHLEIEKSRARSFAQGQHPFDIRDGKGTSTRSWENPDDPRTSLHPMALRAIRNIEKSDEVLDYHAYLQIFPSLHYLSKEFGSRSVASQPMVGRLVQEYAPFGIPYLDNMLHPNALAGGGAPSGLVTALIGDEGTRKISLAEQFLINAYEDLPQILKYLLMLSAEYRKLPSQSRDSQTFVGYIIQNANRAKEFLADCKASDATIARIADRLAGFGHGLREADDLNEVATSDVALTDAGRSENNLPLKTRWSLKTYVRTREIGDEPDSSILATAFSALRLSFGLLPPTVLIATHDTSSETISESIVERHQAVIREILSDYGLDQEKSLHFLQHLIEGWVTVRRVELIDAPAPQLWHVIRSSVINGIKQLGHSSEEIENSVDPMVLAKSVRVVISDLRSMRDTYPAVAKDPLFLPTVVFRLKRLGVTTLIVESDNGRLNQAPGHPMSGALRSLVDSQISTWKVNFFGTQRVALTVLPSGFTPGVSLFRELLFRATFPHSQSSNVNLIVDPHFELFENIDEGRPTAVPLQVAIYEETPAFREYVDSEASALRLLFSPESIDASSDVLRVVPSRDYSALRDYTQLPIERKLPFSLIFMVDGFWALRRKNSLRNQSRYLFDPINSISGKALDTDYCRFEDPLKMFVPSHKDTVTRVCRADFFQQEPPSGYRHRIPEGDVSIDRVPFMWDFGFLLCNDRQWLRASKSVLAQHVPFRPREQRVRDVFDRMVRFAAPGPSDAEQTDLPKVLNRKRDGQTQENVSWREFFAACKSVAETESRRTQTHARPFDVATSPESLTCMLMEVWASEILQDISIFSRLSELLPPDNLGLKEDVSKWIALTMEKLRCLSTCQYEGPNHNEDRPDLSEMLDGDTVDFNAIDLKMESLRKRFGVLDAEDPDFHFALNRFFLVQSFESYSLHLYQAWLLLVEVMDFEDYLDDGAPFELRRDRKPDPLATATRHWYKTACEAITGERRAAEGESVIQTLVPARLPGYFTTRGDWFLAVANGSRSHRLADSALDLLSSRRANRTRLHLGLGLPVREITPDREINSVRTRIRIETLDGSYDAQYGKLLELTGDYLEKCTGPYTLSKSANFFWLFRSGFKNYDREAIVIRRWIQRMFAWTIRFRFEVSADWQGGFAAYDALIRGDISVVKDYPSVHQFIRGVHTLTSDLYGSALRENPSNPAGLAYAQHG